MNALLPINTINTAMDAREAEAPQYRLRRLIQNRSRRRALVNHHLDHRAELLGYLSSFPAPHEFETVGEAICWFRREMKRQRGLAEFGHWAFSNSILAACKDRLIIARYFAWVKKAEATDMMREAA